MQIKFKTCASPMEIKLSLLPVGNRHLRQNHILAHIARFFCIFILDLLKEAVFHLFAS